MNLPPHYGQTGVPVIRQGPMPYGTLRENLMRVGEILTATEVNVEEAKKTQHMYQILAVAGTVTISLVGVYVFLQIMKNVDAK